MAVAFTTIRHGKDDGSVVEVKENDTVKGLPEDVVKSLKEQGLVGDPPKTQAEKDDDLAAAQAEIASLRAKLEEAEKSSDKK